MQRVLRVLLGSILTAVGALGAHAQVFTDRLQLADRYPIDGVLADITGDGLSDLVTVSNTPVAGQNGQLRLYANTGNGVFGASTSFAVGPYANDLDVGDLNGDARPDAVVVDFQQDLVYVFLATAGGSFSANGTFSTHGVSGTGVGPVSITLALVNGDSNLDVVTTSNSQDVSILLGNGAGSLAAATTFSVGAVTGASATNATAADLDNDGDRDLVMPLSYPNHQVSVWLNNGSGAFAFGVYITTAIDASTTRVADFDLDGKPDIAAALPYANAVHVYRGTGTGTGYAAAVVLAEAGQPTLMQVGEFNGDGKPDLVTHNLNSSFSVFLGTGTVSVSKGVQGRYATNPYGVAIATGQLDAGGKLDVATISNSTYGAGGVIAHLYAGSGNFASARSYTIPIYGASAAIGEFNGDGKRDLIIAHFQPLPGVQPELSLILQRTAGVFGTTTSIPMPIATGCAVVGDVDYDGKDDVVAVATGGFSAPGSSILVLRGVGNGTFLAPVAFPVGGLMPRNVTLADVDRDGRLDAITANLVSQDISVLLATPTGWGFQAPAVYTVTSSAFWPYMVAAGQLNADQLPDLVVAHNESSIGHLTVLLGIGGGAFNPAAATAVPIGGFLPIWAAVGDLTGDSKPDLASANSYSPGNDVGIAPGNGLGGFGAPATLGVHPQPFAIGLADFNSDGQNDIVTSHVVQTNHVAVMLSTGGGTFAAPQLYASGDRPQSLAVGDVNADGLPDLITVNYDSGNVAVHLK